MQFLSTLSLLLLAAVSQALRFELPAQQAQYVQPRCIRNFVNRDVLVVVTATVSGNRGDGQRVNVDIRDTEGNEYGRPRDVSGETRMAFTPHEDTAVDVCFENIASEGHAPGAFRSVELDVDIGSAGFDYNALQKSENLKPIEVELRRIEDQINEIVHDLDYLKLREQTMRNTNESTNDRVKGFAILSSMILLGLTIWQIVYLRTYFKRKGMLE